MLEVGRLRALLAMSEHGGSSGAARALGRPAGDVAGQLSDWERELGLPLVDGDRLTPAGRRLAEHAGTLLGQLESAESDAAAVAGRVAGTLRLGVGADAGRVLLPETLATLRSTDVRLHVRQLADERVGALDSTLDVVVVGEYGAAVPHRPDVAVERRELFTEPLLLAVPSRHRATGASVRLAELAGEAWIAGAGDTLVALERAAAGAGFAPRVVAEVGEDALALTLVAAGLGVALRARVGGAVAGRGGAVPDRARRRAAPYRARRGAPDPDRRPGGAAAARRARERRAAGRGGGAGRDRGGDAAGAARAAAAPAEPGRRPDPLFDPLPPEPAPRSNGRRDPWADRVRPEGRRRATGPTARAPTCRRATGLPRSAPTTPPQRLPDRPAGPRRPTSRARERHRPARLLRPGRPPRRQRRRPAGRLRPGRPRRPSGPVGPSGRQRLGRAGRLRRPGRPSWPRRPSWPADLPGRTGSSDRPAPAGRPGRPTCPGDRRADRPGYGGPRPSGRPGPADLPGRNGTPGFGGPGDLSDRAGRRTVPAGPDRLTCRVAPARRMFRASAARLTCPADRPIDVPGRRPGRRPGRSGCRHDGRPPAHGGAAGARAADG